MASGDSTDQQGRSLDSSDQKGSSWLSPRFYLNKASTLISSIGFGPQEEEEISNMADKKGEEPTDMHRDHGVQCQSQSQDYQTLLEDCVKENDQILSDTLHQRNQQLIALRAEARVMKRTNQFLESKNRELNTRIEELESRPSQMSKLRKNKGKEKDQDVPTVMKLQEHVEKQSKIIRDLKKDQELRQSETSEDKQKIFDMEDEIMRLREDFESARESMEKMKKQNKTSSSESFFQHESVGGGVDSCSNPTCQAMYHHMMELQQQAEERKRGITSLEKVVANLQQEKNVAMEQCALAKVEAEIFKSDFEEERKDRTRAQGLLADFQNKKSITAVYQEQEKKLQQERDTAIRERNDLKRELSKAKAELTKHKDKIVMRDALQQHISETERIGREKGYYKDKVKLLEDEVLSSKKVILQLQKSAESMEKLKEKELKRAEEQIKHGILVNVRLTNAFEKAKENLSSANKDIQELKKIKRSLENHVTKLEKGKRKTSQQHPDQDESSYEHLYDKELQTNLELKSHIECLEGQIRDLTMDITEYKGLMHDLTIYQSQPDEETATVSANSSKRAQESQPKSKAKQSKIKPPSQQVMTHELGEEEHALGSHRSHQRETIKSQPVQSSHFYEPVPGKHSQSDENKPTTDSNSYGVPPLPPREPSSQSNQPHNSNAGSTSMERLEHEHLHQNKHRKALSHESKLIPSSNKDGVSEPVVCRETHSEFPVNESGRPLRAGGGPNPVVRIGYHDQPKDMGNHHRHGDNSSYRDENDHRYCKERAKPTGENITQSRHGNKDSQFSEARYDEGPQSAPCNSSSRRPRADAVGSKPFVSGGDGRNRVLPDEEHRIAGYDSNSRRPLRAGAEGSQPFSSNGDKGNRTLHEEGHHSAHYSSNGRRPLRAGAEGGQHIVGSGEVQSLHDRKAEMRNEPHNEHRNYSHPLDPTDVPPNQRGIDLEREHNFSSHSQGRTKDSLAEKNQRQQEYWENQAQRRGNSSNDSGMSKQPYPPTLDHCQQHDEEKKFGVPSQERVTDLNPVQQCSRDYHNQQHQSGISNAEKSNRQLHPRSNSPLMRHEVLQQSQRNDKSHLRIQNQGQEYQSQESTRRSSHPNLKVMEKQGLIEQYPDQMQAADTADASHQASCQFAEHLTAASQEVQSEPERKKLDMPANSQVKYSDAESTTARQDSQKSGKGECFSEELSKTELEDVDRRKHQSLPQHHYDGDVKDGQVDSTKGSSAMNIVTSDKSGQKDQVMSSTKVSKSEESKSAGSEASSDNEDNSLHTGIDDDIKVMAQEVEEEVNRDPKLIATVHRKPYDPNLICPLCGKQFRIGEIQKFRSHVDKCV